MFGFPFLPHLLAAAVLFGLLNLVLKLCSYEPFKEIETLDRISLVTNILLIIAFLPISVQALFSGRLYVADGTVLQDSLCRLHNVLVCMTPLAAYGGIVVSWKLRGNGHSVKSFLFQFLGLLHLALLYPLPELINRVR